MDGIALFYDANGNKERQVTYKNDKEIGWGYGFKDGRRVRGSYRTKHTLRRSRHHSLFFSDFSPGPLLRHNQEDLLSGEKNY